MADASKPEFTTILASDCSFKGEMTFEGTMKVDGKFEGKITTKGKLGVGKGAHLCAEAIVGQASIEGAFKGNVVASERIELAASASVMADLRAPKLVVAEGATFVGNVHVSPDALKGVEKSEFVVPIPATPLKK